MPYGVSTSETTPATTAATAIDNRDVLNTSASKPTTSITTTATASSLNSFRLGTSIFRSIERPVLNTNTSIKNSTSSTTSNTATTNIPSTLTESVQKSVIQKSPRSPRHVSHPQAYEAKGQFIIDLQKFRSDKYDVDLNTITSPSNSTITNTSNTMIESISHTRLNFSVHIVRCFL